MSRTNRSNKQPIKPKFDTKPYERPGLTSSDILEIKESFDIFDREHLGIINPKDLKNSLSSLGPEAKKEPIYQVILDYESEGSGYISFEQFIHLLTSKILEEDTRENIDKIFSLFDSQKTGFICSKDLRRISHEMGLDLSEQDINDMILRADEDKDGQVSSQQFFHLLSNTAA